MNTKLATPAANTLPEAVLEPMLPIVDAHHHVRDRAGDRYMFDDLRADLATGHNVVATVAVECEDMYRAYGPPSMRAIGETEFLAGIAAMFDSGRYGATRACAGIVGFADLRLDSLDDVLDAQSRAAGGRLCGIRNMAAWDADERLRSKRTVTQGLLADPAFRRGARSLAERGLPLDIWAFHTQLHDIAALAEACPQTTIVLNHLGGPVGAGPYLGKREEVFVEWRKGLGAVAKHHNVVCKLGGLGQRVVGLALTGAGTPGSAGLADLWRPYIETGLGYFGVERCMFESNFPPDSVACTYPVLWNAFKRVTAGSSQEEKAALFCDTAARVYGLAVAPNARESSG